MEFNRAIEGIGNWSSKYPEKKEEISFLSISTNKNEEEMWGSGILAKI